jgi:WD40 repeat protein
MSIPPWQKHSTAILHNAMAEGAKKLNELIEQAQSEHCTERVLTLFPELNSNRDSVLELLYLEHLYRQEVGEHRTSEMALSEFVRRFPDLKDELIKLFSVSDAIVGSNLKSERTDAGQTTRGSSGHEVTGDSNSTSMTLRDYVLLEEIGRGGMGIVYRALQRGLSRIVAVKTLSSLDQLDQRALSRLQREAELASSLQHPNIVPIHEVGISGGIPFFSMEYVEGGSLEQAIRDRPLRPDLAAQLVGTVARAVAFAHTKGVVHRDLKPGNILLAPSLRPEALLLSIEGSTPQKEYAQTATSSGARSLIRVEPKIVDFGLAMDCSLQSAIEGVKLVGTPSYMAPEQIDKSHGPIGPACDIYSLGSILYQLLVGRPPFCAPSTQETLRQVREDEPIPPRSLQSKIPVDLETICLHCLRKTPTHRYASALDLADDLQRFLEAKPIHARPASALKRVYKWGLRNPSLVVLFASMFIAVLITTWLWHRSELSLAAERAEKERSNRLIYNRDVSLAYFNLQAQNSDRAKELLESCRVDLRNWEWQFVHRLVNEPIWQGPSMSDHRLLAADLSPNGQYVATGHGQWGTDAQQQIYVWDVHSNQLIWKLNGHPPCAIGNVHFGPDNKSLLTCGVVWENRNSFGKVLEWNLETGSLHREYANINAYVARYEPYGKYVLIGDVQGNVHVHSRKTGEREHLFKLHQGMVLSMAISSDGRYVASSARDGTFAIVEISSGKTICSLNQLGDPRVVEWSPDMKRIQIVDFSGEVAIYRWEDNRLRRESSYARKYGECLAYAPDGQTYATAVFGDGADLRDSTNGRILFRFRGHRGHVRKVAFDANGQRLLTAGADGTCRVWDLLRPDAYQRTVQTNGGAISAIAFRPGKKEFAIAVKRHKAKPAYASGNPRIELWSSDTQKLVRTFLGHKDWPTALAFSPDGNKLISGSLDTSVLVWNTDSDHKVGTFDDHENPIAAVSFLDLHTALSLDTEGVVHLWNPEKLQSIRSWSVLEHVNASPLLPNLGPCQVTAACTHQGNRVLAVAHATNIDLWDIDTGERLCSGTTNAKVNEIQFSSDGQRLAIAMDHQQTWIWDVSKSKSHRVVSHQLSIPGHSENITSVAFSPDNQRLVTSSRDETVRLFDINLGSELLKFDEARGEFNLVAFSHDGRQIARAEGRSVWLYSLDPIDSKNHMSSNETLVQWYVQQITHALLELDHYAFQFHARKVVEIFPNSPSHQFVLVTALINNGNWDEAKQVLTQIEANDDVTAIMQLTDLCRIALLSGNSQDYEGYCKKLSSIRTESRAALDRQAWYLALGKASNTALEDWVPKMEAICKSYPSINYQRTLALLYCRSRRYSDAIETIDQAWKVKKPPTEMLDRLIRALAHSEWERTRETTSDLNTNTKDNDDINAEALANMKIESIPRLPIHARIQEDLDLIRNWQSKMPEQRDAGIKPSLAQFRLEQLEIPLLMKELEQSIRSLPGHPFGSKLPSEIEVSQKPDGR